MPLILKNNVSSTLTVPISASDTGIAVVDGGQFPALGAGDYFYATLVSPAGATEIVKVTARAGNSMTVVRAQDGSSAASFQAGALVEMRVNAASIAEISDEASEISIADAGGYYTATDVEGALQEVGADLRTQAAQERDTVATLLADTTLSYAEVAAGDILRTRAEGFSYEVAPSSATDHHVATAGGVKLYVLPAEDDSVSILQFGADTSLANNAPMIQMAWDNFRWVKHPLGTFDTTEPLYIRQNNLRLSGVVSAGGGLGTAGRSARIRKTTDAVGTGSNTTRGGSVTDSYAVNAIVIATHPDGGYRSHVTIEFLTFEAENFDVELGIFAPRVAMWTMDNVAINRSRIGWRTFDAWLQDWRSVRYHGFTVSAAAAAAGVGAEQGWATGTVGFQWAPDGSGGGTGPGNTFKSCWARNCHRAWDITGMGYGHMQSCGADNLSFAAYKFESARVTLSGCAMENVYVGSWMIEVVGSNSYVVMDGFTSDGRMRGNPTPTTAMLRVGGGARLVMDGCRLEDFVTPEATFNLSIVGGSRLISNNSRFPTNGNTFLGYSGGATWVDTSNGVTEWRSAGATLSSNQILSGVQPFGGSAAQIRRTNKAVAAAGGEVLSVELQGAASITRAHAYLDVEVRWWDLSYPNGMGVSKFTVLCYRYDGPNYRQSVAVYHEARAGADLTGFPAFAIARTGDTWSVTMTPANGDLTCDINVLASRRVFNGGSFEILAP
jgi:hypothetical protein